MLTIVTPANTFNLIDVADARDALSITGLDQDANLSALIDRASDVIARECGRVFALETVAEQYRLARRADELILTRFPLAEVVSIIENDTALAASDYEASTATGVLTRLANDRTWHWPAGKIVVTYRTGFDLPSGAPKALQQACLQLVKAYYLGADRDPMIRSETVTPMTSATYFGNAEHLPPDVLGLLEHFSNARAG